MAFDDLIREYGTSYDALRLSIGDALEQLWLEIGGPEAQRAAAFAEAAVELVNAATVETAELTAAYVDLSVGAVTGRPPGPSPLDLADYLVDQLRGGVSGTDVYRRPAVTARRVLAEGRGWDEAMQVAGSRVSAMGAADVGLAHRQAAVDAMGAHREVAGYRRVLTGVSCTLCMVASTQRYLTGALMPIHTRCDCRVAPIIGDVDPGRVINRELYRELKASGAMSRITKGRKATAGTDAARRGQAQARRQAALDRREQLRLELAGEPDVGRQGRLELRIDTQNDIISAADGELDRLGSGPVRRTTRVDGPLAPFDDPTGVGRMANGPTGNPWAQVAADGYPTAWRRPSVVEHGEMGPVLTDARHAATVAKGDGLVARDPVPTTDGPVVPVEAPAKPAPVGRYSEGSPEVLRLAARKNLSPTTAAEQLNRKAAARASEQAAQRAAARSLTVDSPEVIAVAERFGVSADEVMIGRVRVREARRLIADEAARVQSSTFAQLDQVDAAKMTRPPRVRAGGEYDWLEKIDKAERARLARVWFTNAPEYAPDLLAEALDARVGGDWSTDDAAEWWLERTRTIEAAGALRRGKLPSSRAYSGQIDPDLLLPEFAGSGYSVTKVLGPELEAAAHVAQVDRVMLAAEAEQYLGAAALDPQHGPPAWRMSWQTWEAEVRTLEHAAREGIPAEFDIDGVTVVLDPVTVQARLDELVPAWLDEPGTSFEELYARVLATARRGQEVPDYARIPW